MVDNVNIINLNTVNITNWIKEPNHIYIGRRHKELRPSKWRNPYKIQGRNRGRSKVVRLFVKHLQKNQTLVNSIWELKDKVLGCWCAPRLCHAQVLHHLAGNKSVYQSATNKTVMESESFLQQQLDRELTNVLQSMSDVLENRENNSAVQSPIPPFDATTPSLDMSTAETNSRYEALLEPSSSCNSSFEKTSTRSEDPVNPDAKLDSKWERLEIRQKIINLQLQQLSKSFHASSLFSPSRNLVNGRRHSLPSLPRRQSNSDPVDTVMPRQFYSAPTSPIIPTSPTIPTSPIKKPSHSLSTNSTSHSADSSVLPPRSFIYDSINTPISPTLDEGKDTLEPDATLDEGKDPLEPDATQSILEFLAHKVDLLAINVNSIQFNLNQMAESIKQNQNDNAPVAGLVETLEETTKDKILFLENKFDCYKINLDIELQAMKEENANLRNRLESYIIQETDREELMRECLNTPQNVPNCITDLQPLKEDLEKKIKEDIEKKLLDLDTRLVECEQYSRRESLIISGIPSSIKQNDLEKKVIDILGLIGLNIIPDDISACHRLFNPPTSRFPGKVIVRFCNRKIANFCLEHKDDLQQKAYAHLRLNLRFYESLCSKNEESLRISKWLCQHEKIHDYYLRNGFVKIVADENGRPEKIKHPDFLRKKFDISEMV